MWSSVRELSLLLSSSPLLVNKYYANDYFEKSKDLKVGHNDSIDYKTGRNDAKDCNVGQNVAKDYKASHNDAIDYKMQEITCTPRKMPAVILAVGWDC